MAHCERRVMLAPVEYRKSVEGVSSLVGHGAVFNRETEIAGLFRERIAPGAFARTAKEDDIRILFNHDPNHVIGRQSAGAIVEEDGIGLRYEAEIDPEDTDAVSVAAKVKGRKVTGSSFSFSVERDEDEEWIKPESRGGLPLRIIHRAKVFDVGPVTFPAYDAAEVSARSVAKADELSQAERRAIEAAEAAKTPDQQRVDALVATLAERKAWKG